MEKIHTQQTAPASISPGNVQEAWFLMCLHFLLRDVFTLATVVFCLLGVRSCWAEAYCNFYTNNALLGVPDSFMRRSVRCGHKRRQRRGSGRQCFLILMASRDRRHGVTCPATWKNHQGEHGQNTGMRGEFEPQPTLGFPWGM